MPINGWAGCNDAARGNVLLVNSDAAANARGWFRNVSVTNGRTYVFSVQAASASWRNPAQLYLRAGTTVIGSVVTLPSPNCNWVTITGTFTATSTANIEISVRNAGSGCAGNDYMLDNMSFRERTTTTSGAYTWTRPDGSFLSDGSGANIQNANASHLGTYTLTYTNNNCSYTSTEVVTLKQVATVTASADNSGSICANATAQLDATVVDPLGNNGGTWSWTGPNGFTSNIRNPTVSAFSSAKAGIYTVTYTPPAGGCAPVQATTTLALSGSTTDAGADQLNLCVPNATLQASTPSVGTGTWSVISPSGFDISNISNVNSASATVSNLPVGVSVTLRWTISGSACDGSDDVVIRNSSVAKPNAGIDRVNCNASSFVMAGSAIPAGATAQWTRIGGTANPVINNGNSANANVDNVFMGQTAVMEYRITLNGCSATDTVVLTNINPQSITANAGSDEIVCEKLNGTFTISANTPAAGLLGTWSVVSPSNFAVSNISNINAPNATVSNVPFNTSITLRWTVSVEGGGSSCAPVADDVVIRNNELPLAPTATNTVINYCVGDAASALSANGTGLRWYSVASGGSNSPSAPTPTTNTAGTQNYWVSQVVNNCESPRLQISVNIQARPTFSIPDTTVCDASTITLSAPNGATGTSTWTTVSGIGSIGSPNANSTLIALTPASTSAPCPISSLPTGGLLRERFDNIGGTAVSDMTSHSSYPNFTI
ncbi:MAG: hypothetical protein HC817_05710, partial [Saprospiraceae bacterium]|nr:hypothetical protein [Saprospiraceae bacterium]